MAALTKQAGRFSSRLFAYADCTLSYEEQLPVLGQRPKLVVDDLLHLVDVVAYLVEVYGNGIIKSIQKIESLGSEEKCDLVVISGSCNGGGTKNEAIFAFGYTDDCTDVNRYAALYWPELGNESYFGRGYKVTKDMVLDLSSYPTFATYEPKVNEMAALFESIFD